MKQWLTQWYTYYVRLLRVGSTCYEGCKADIRLYFEGIKPALHVAMNVR